jgi:hypothetical protein
MIINVDLVHRFLLFFLIKINSNYFFNNIKYGSIYVYLIYLDLINFFYFINNNFLLIYELYFFNIFKKIYIYLNKFLFFFGFKSSVENDLALFIHSNYLKNFFFKYYDSFYSILDQKFYYNNFKKMYKYKTGYFKANSFKFHPYLGFH